MNREEILKKYIPKDCYWEEMGNLTNCPQEFVFAAMSEYSDSRCRGLVEALEKILSINNGIENDGTRSYTQSGLIALDALNNYKQGV